MADWTAPADAIQTDAEKLSAYVQAQFPDSEVQIQVTGGKLAYLELADLDDAGMVALIQTLQAQFPGAF